MNEELTNEVLEAIKRCSETSCSECLAVDVCCSKDDITIGERLATALIEERARPKVWKFAPITADCAVVYYYVGNTFFGEKTYTRELPKTRARKDAEELFDELSFQCLGRKQGIDAIESALIKYAEELKEASHDK
jgi:hypothetical protein